MQDDIVKQVIAYYSNKVKAFGSTPKGVDWNSAESQFLRFKQLLKIVPETEDNFSILDYGCGYGALLDYLIRVHNKNFQYTGFDVSEDMIREGMKYVKTEKANWVSKKESILPSDFIIASGIFNVKQNSSDEAWLTYIVETLDHINTISKKGFSFNILTKYSDSDFKKNNLYYADPGWFFDLCKKNFSKNVALLHDYGLYEFTLLIRKNIL